MPETIFENGNKTQGGRKTAGGRRIPGSAGRADGRGPENIHAAGLEGRAKCYRRLAANSKTLDVGQTGEVAHGGFDAGAQAVEVLELGCPLEGAAFGQARFLVGVAKVTMVFLARLGGPPSCSFTPNCSSNTRSNNPKPCIEDTSGSTVNRDAISNRSFATSASFILDSEGLTMEKTANDFIEHRRGDVVFHEQAAGVIKCLGADVRCLVRLVGDVERVMPLLVERHMLDGLFVGQVVYLL